jgi:hypothetical protein
LNERSGWAGPGDHDGWNAQFTDEDMKANLIERDPRKGELTRALARHDAAGIARGITECSDINRGFFGLTLPLPGELNTAAP